LPGPVNETSKAEPTLTLPGNGPNTAPQQALDLATPKATKAGNPQAMLVLDAFVSGKTIPDIVREIYGHTGGRNYNAATFEVQNILRDHLSQK
jgi:hypothetical protein